MPIDVRRPLENLLPDILEARRSGLDEAGTVALVSRVFAEALGYDPKKELTGEKAVASFVDLAVKLGDEIPLLIEVVAAETALQPGHIAEARRAAARDNVSYILLTNGVAWNLYHVTLDETLAVSVVFAVSLRDGVDDEAAALLGLLHRQGLTGGALREYWERRSRLRPDALGRALFTRPVLAALREELGETGIPVDSRVLAACLHDLLSPAAQLAIGAVDVDRGKAKG